MSSIYIDHQTEKQLKVKELLSNIKKIDIKYAPKEEAPTGPNTDPLPTLPEMTITKKKGALSLPEISQKDPNSRELDDIEGNHISRVSIACFFRRDMIYQSFMFYMHFSLIIFYIISVIIGFSGLLTPTEESLLTLGAISSDIINTKGEYWRLLTQNFLHSNLIHLFFTLFSASTISMFHEYTNGRSKCMLIYIGSSLLSCFYSANMPHTTVSGSLGVYGIYSSLIVNYLYNDQLFSTKSLILLSILPIFGLLLSQISILAHIASFLFGGLLTLLFILDDVPRLWKWFAGVSIIVLFLVPFF